MAAFEVIALNEAIPQLGAPGVGDTYVANRDFAMGASNAFGFSTDLFLRRDAANTLALRNGTNAQAFNLYNTFTDASNYERGFFRYVSNVLQIGSEAAGTGTVRNVVLFRGTANHIQLESGRTLLSIFPTIGGTTQLAFSNGVNFSRGISFSAGGGLAITNGSTGGESLEFREITAPAAPATNGVYVYAEDNGSGKTRLMARFATGAAQQIAIEP